MTGSPGPGSPLTPSGTTGAAVQSLQSKERMFRLKEEMRMEAGVDDEEGIVVEFVGASGSARRRESRASSESRK